MADRLESVLGIDDDDGFDSFLDVVEKAELIAWSCRVGAKAK